MTILRVKPLQIQIAFANNVISSATQGKGLQDESPQVNGHPKAADAPESFKMRATGLVVEGRSSENSLPENISKNILGIWKNKIIRGESVPAAIAAG
ncbi:MAG TPA: hypothetical protein VFQ00_14665 [Terriglobales bacterium]|nr:hypothetical protein [Terriglobales bacterium]